MAVDMKVTFVRNRAEKSGNCGIGYICIRCAARLVYRHRYAGRCCAQIADELEPRIGNPPPRVAETASGVVNSVGLQNPGVDAFLQKEMKQVEKLGTVVIANVAGSTIEDYVAVIEKLNAANVDMFELNISCPNVREGGASFGSSPKMAAKCTKAAKAAAGKPLIVKLTPAAADVADVAKAVE